MAYVADMFSTPLLFAKAVTDIVDRKTPTAEEFLQISDLGSLKKAPAECGGLRQREAHL